MAKAQRFRALILLFSASLGLVAQNRAIDSLERLLGAAADDTAKVLLLDNLLVKYQNAAQYDSSLARGGAGLKLAVKLDYQRGIADIYNDLANTYYLKGDFQQAIACHEKAIDIRLRLGHRKKLGRSYNNLGACYERAGNYPKALDYHLRSLRIKEELKDSVGIMKAYNNVGNLHLIQQNYPLALDYYQRSYQLADHMGDQGQASMALDNIASVYDGQKDYRKALHYETESMKLSEALDDRYMMGVNYTNIAGIYDNLQEYDRSLEYYLKALKVWTEDGNEDGVAGTCVNLGQYYYKIKKDYKTAAAYLERSLQYKQHKKTLADTYFSLAELHAAMGNYKKAYDYAGLSSGLQKELFNEESATKIADMQTRYETEKKEKENAELRRKSEVQQLQIKAEGQKRKSQLLLGAGLVVLLVLVGLFFHYRHRSTQRARLAREMADQEKLRFKAVIEAEEKERSRIAQDLHDGLGQLLSAARLNVAGLDLAVAAVDRPQLDRALRIIDDACLEVRSVSHNMMPHALIRLGLIPAIEDLVTNINLAGTLKVDFSSNLKGSLGQSLDITIYRIVQEILNNMMKHARADHIRVEISKKDDLLEVTLHDNGIGFDPGTLKNSKGLGWKGVFSRVSMLDGTIELDSREQQGTMVYISLRLKNSPAL